jgi:DNA repair protein RadC
MPTRSSGVREMAPDEQPRERMLRWGASQLRTDELLAVLLNTGTEGESVVKLADRLLAEHGGLRGLMRMDLADLISIRGIGPAKATRLRAALELANRVVALDPDERPQISSPDDVVRLIGPEMASLDHEQLRVVLVDTRNRVLAVRTVYKGSVNQAQVRVSEVFQDAIRQNATSVVVVHNHPSGDHSPSTSDIALTADIERAGRLLGIDVLDHLVVGTHGHTSMRRLGLGFSVVNGS